MVPALPSLLGPWFWLSQRCAEPGGWQVVPLCLANSHLKSWEGLSESQSLTFQSQLIFLHFLPSSGGEQATTVGDNPVHVLEAQACKYVLQEQECVLFSMKYFAAEILMCPGHCLPCSLLTQCFHSSHSQWYVKAAAKQAGSAQQSCVSSQPGPA